MNTEELINPGAISSKIFSLLIFIFLEIVCNTLTFFYDATGERNTNFRSEFKGGGLPRTLAFVFAG